MSTFWQPLHGRLLRLALSLLFCLPAGVAVADSPPRRDESSAGRVVMEDEPREGESSSRASKARARVRVYRSGERKTAARRTSYGRSAVHRGFVPRHQRMTTSRVVQSDEPEIVEGPMGEQILEEPFLYDQIPGEIPGGLPGELPPEMYPIDDCGGGSGCGQCGAAPCITICWNNFELFTGTHGVTGPANRGETASFGFHEGVNWASALPCSVGQLGMQLGTQVYHSNYSGASFTNDERTQAFVTGGLFRRVDWGLQGGLVVDYMHDDWYYDIDPVQLRGEVSWMYPQNHELGFWFTSGVSDVTSDSVVDGNVLEEQWEVTDLYAFFYRYRSDNFGGGEGRFFAGFTGESDGLLGSQLSLPVSDQFEVQTAVTYLVPEENNGNAFVEESWALVFNMVWTPGRGYSAGRNYYRPLFRVAGNDSFLMDRQ